jgi:hypothetical protein
MGLSDILEDVSASSMEGVFPARPAPAAAPSDAWSGSGNAGPSVSGSASAEGAVSAIPFQGALRASAGGEKVGGPGGLSIDDKQKDSLWLWSKTKQLQEKAAKAEASGDTAEAEKARMILRWTDPLSMFR